MGNVWRGEAWEGHGELNGVMEAITSYDCFRTHGFDHQRCVARCVPQGWSNPTSPLGVGGLGCFLFHPILPLRGRVYPSHYPFPLGLHGGGGARRLERPRWPKMAARGLRERKVASKIAQDSFRSLKIACNMLQKAPRPLQDGSECSPRLRALQDAKIHSKT